MMRKTMKLSLLLAAAALAACGEKPQTIGAGKMDVQPYQGADNSFVAAGWKAGDKTSWEQALKARALSTQNEYSRTK
jgi:hypothetical protein